MFSGIVESLGAVKSIERQEGNQVFRIASELVPELSVDQSLAHNGVCLTVEAVFPQQGQYQVTAVQETLRKTNLGALNEGSEVNLERSVNLQTRLDGHLVLGHVDALGTCERIAETGGSWEMDFRFESAADRLLVEKGSVAVNGISLTVFNVSEEAFRVAIIPYTYQHTNLKALRQGDAVNLEFDVLGKYVAQYLSRLPLSERSR
jgi:riboflavin synthase